MTNPKIHMIESKYLDLFDGGGKRDRTDDPLLAKQMLSQLSYTPTYVVQNEQPSMSESRYII